MPRKRQIDPGIWTDRDFIRLTQRQRLLFIGLFSQADDEGLIESDYQYLKAIIFPCDTWTQGDYEGDLKACGTCGLWAENGRKKAEKVALVVEYREGGRRFLWLPKWFRYQVIDHPSPSKLPRPNKKLLDRFPEYHVGWRKYFSEYSKSPLGVTLRTFETGNSLLGDREGLASSSLMDRDTEKPDEDPHWSYRCAVAFGGLCETPHLKTKQKWCRDLARQGVPKRVIEEAAMDPKYKKWAFFSILDDLKEIHLNGGRDAGPGAKRDDRRSNAGAQAIVGHFALGPDELERKVRDKVARREAGGDEGGGGPHPPGAPAVPGEAGGVPGAGPV